jgi:hypothetical protein
MDNLEGHVKRRGKMKDNFTLTEHPILTTSSQPPLTINELG